ncbi:MAG: glycosyltransferase [Actinomycetota bacterium]|nr:glycosyltransferase [Actinomycetota bacterium]
MPGGHADVLVVSLGTTIGWRAAAHELTAALGRAGAHAVLVIAGPVPRVRTFALTDLAEAIAVRRAAATAIAAHQPSAVIYCSITASLLWPAPGAIWLDSTARENRPGRHGVWQRSVERRRLAQAPLVMPMSIGAMAPLRDRHAGRVVVPVPVEPSGPLLTGAARDVDAVAYAGDPVKRRLDVILAAWRQARREGETLVVAGTDTLEPSDGIEVAGRLAPAEYRALLRRARVLVTAPRREDYGIAALEALADGCMLVSTPSPGPYPALGLARTLDSRLVAEDLAGALRTALDDPVSGYHEKAAELLEPFRRAAVDRTIECDVLPRLTQR